MAADEARSHDTPRVCSWWFERASAVALAFRILKAVADGAFDRLAVIKYKKDDGLTHIKFRVMHTGESASAGEPDINESWPCPPWDVPPGSGNCPGGG